MLDDLKFVSHRDPKDELGVIERAWRDKSEALAKAAQDWRADKLTKDNLAKQVAEYLAGKSVVVYGADRDQVAIWYQNIALRAQARVFGVVVEESAATELAAWRSQPVDKLFGIILLRSAHDSAAAQTVFETMNQKLSGLWPHPLAVELAGKTVDEQRDWSHFLGELSAVYLAILHGVNPAPK